MYSDENPLSPANDNALHGLNMPSMEDVLNQDTTDMFAHTVRLLNKMMDSRNAATASADVLGVPADGQRQPPPSPPEQSSSPQQSSSQQSAPQSAVRKVPAAARRSRGTNGGRSTATAVKRTPPQPPKRVAGDSTSSAPRSNIFDSSQQAAAVDRAAAAAALNATSAAWFVQQPPAGPGEGGELASGGCCRDFHTFVRTVMLYSNLTREDRSRLSDELVLTKTERMMCLGQVSRRHVRDILRSLCFGAKLNIDRVRVQVQQQVNAAVCPTMTFAQLTDKYMLKYVNVWYEPDWRCEWHERGVSVENIMAMLNTNAPVYGKACYDCVNAVVRLGRTGLSQDLARQLAPPDDDTAATGSFRSPTAAAPAQQAPLAKSATATKKRKSPTSANDGGGGRNKRQKSPPSVDASSDSGAKRRREGSAAAAAAAAAVAKTVQHPQAPVTENGGNYIAPRPVGDTRYFSGLPPLTDTEPFLLQSGHGSDGEQTQYPDMSTTAVSGGGGFVTPRIVPVGKKKLNLALPQPSFHEEEEEDEDEDEAYDEYGGDQSQGSSVDEENTLDSLTMEPEKN